MRIQRPFTSKRILAVVLGLILFGFAAIILSTNKVGDTLVTLCSMSSFMVLLGVVLVGYGLFGGKEPQLGLLPKKDETPEE